MLDRTAVTEEMREVASDFVGIDPVELDLNKKLRLDYAITSIEASELIMEMEDRFNLRIPTEEALKILSTQDAIEYVLKNAN